MPRLRDFPEAVRRVGWWTFIKRVWAQIGEDNIFTWAAAMAYSWLFAVFPFLIFLLTLVPYLPLDKARVTDQVGDAIRFSLSEDASEPIVAQVTDLLNKPRRGLMSTGIIIALWAASGGMAMTMAALNTCYDVKETRPFYVARPMAVMITLIVASLIIGVLVLLPVGSAITLYFQRYMSDKGEAFSPIITVAWNLARWGLALVMMVTAVGIVYHFGPVIKRRFSWFTPGSVFTIAMWLILGLLLKYYIERFAAESYNKTYGAVGSVVIMLLIFYLDSVVLLIGAEIDSEADFALLSVPTATAPPEITVDAQSSIEPREIAPEKGASPDKTL
jgi:membrane protein